MSAPRWKPQGCGSGGCAHGRLPKKGGLGSCGPVVETQWKKQYGRNRDENRNGWGPDRPDARNAWQKAKCPIEAWD